VRLIVLVVGMAPCSQSMQCTGLTRCVCPDRGTTIVHTPWPTHVTFENFRNAFDTSRATISQGAAHSVIIGAFTTAFACARRDGRLRAGPAHLQGKYLVSGLILSASMFRWFVLVTPLFQLFTNLAGSANTRR